ncbi:MAG: hypothetical protein KR126chlam6_01250, partial [Candidatus Anoxychlamydiales bacterium]|nr:hypothetical protein [Candidatus Anoxychlamydiales bacterium]
MRSSILSKKNTIVLLSSLFPLACIFFAEGVKMYFLELVRAVPNHEQYITYSIYITVLAYPLLAYLSDIWCRKKVLLISLFFLLLSIIFLYFKNFVLSMCFFSIAPVTAVAQAAYCDVHITNEREPNIINTFIIQALPWLIFPFLFNQISSVFISILISGFFLLLLTLFYFKDNRDKDLKKYSFGILEATKKYGLKTCIVIIAAFFLANWAWSMFFYRLEERLGVAVISKYFLLAPGLAFLLGAIFARMIIHRNKILF